MAIQVSLVLATVLCALVAGFLFAFAVVVMPGLTNLGDREFLRAFQVIDGVIQRGQPLFSLVWLGSIVALLAGVALGAGQLAGTSRLLLVAACGLYLLGVQLPTFRVNIPLNNGLQALDIGSADPDTLAAARARFEPRWNRWNRIRTLLSVVTAVLLVLLLAESA